MAVDTAILTLASGRETESGSCLPLVIRHSRDMGLGDAQATITSQTLIASLGAAMLDLEGLEQP